MPLPWKYKSCGRSRVSTEEVFLSGILIHTSKLLVGWYWVVGYLSNVMLLLDVIRINDKYKKLVTLTFILSLLSIFNFCVFLFVVLFLYHFETDFCDILILFLFFYVSFVCYIIPIPFGDRLL